MRHAGTRTDAYDIDNIGNIIAVYTDGYLSGPKANAVLKVRSGSLVNVIVDVLVAVLYII